MAAFLLVVFLVAPVVLLALVVWIASSFIKKRTIAKSVWCVAGAILALEAMNQAGFCWEKFHFFSDSEIVAKYGDYLSPTGPVRNPRNRPQSSGKTQLQQEECCAVRRFQAPGEYWGGSNLQQTFLESIGNRMVGSCLMEVSVVAVNPETHRKYLGQSIYVDACADAVEWPSSGDW